MNPFLAIGQIIVSIALIARSCCRPGGPACPARSAAIRPSTAAAAASSAACGSSRSCCSCCSSLSRSPLHLRARLTASHVAAAHRDGSVRRSSMTRTDSFVVGTLVLLLALVAGLVGAPALVHATAARPPPASPGDLGASRAVPRGRARRARSSISPLAARTAGRPRPRRARLLGPRPPRARRHDRAGPGRALAVDATGQTWTFTSATTRAGTTASRHRGRRRVHRQRPSRTRTTRARGAARGARSRSDAIGRRRPSCSTWRRRSAASCRPATQPIAPAHLLADVPVDALADHPFGAQPSGRGRSR